MFVDLVLVVAACGFAMAVWQCLVVACEDLV